MSVFDVILIASAKALIIFGLCYVLVLDVPFRGGFVLSFRRFVLGVGYGRHSKLIPGKRLRHILLFVRVKCWFRTFLLAAVSSYSLVGSPLVSVLDVPLSRWFRLILSLVRLRCWFWTSHPIVRSR